MKFNPITTYEELKNTDFKSERFYVGVKKKTLLQNPTLIPSFQNLKYNEFITRNDVHIKIINERKYLLKTFEEIYFSDIKSLGKSTVAELINDLNDLLLKMKRMLMIINPTYYNSILEKKGGESKYDKVKIVWLDDLWIKNKNTTRTFGQTGDENLKNSVVKFLVTNENGRNIRDEESIKIEDKVYHFDFVIQIDKIDWVFEVKIKSKEKFIEEMVKYELWELYEKRYKSDEK